MCDLLVGGVSNRAVHYYFIRPAGSSKYVPLNQKVERYDSPDCLKQAKLGNCGALAYSASVADRRQRWLTTV